MNLLGTIDQQKPIVSKEDSWSWVHNSDFIYTVKSAYHVISGVGQQTSIAYELLWVKSIPLKVSAFCWRVTLDRIPTYYNLQRRGVIPANVPLMCKFCNTELETSVHLFLSFRFSYTVWMSVYNLFGLETALSGNFLDLLQQHDGLIAGRTCRKTWHLFWFATIWSLWLHRNDIIFNQDTIDFEKVTDLIKTTVWRWSNALLKK